MNAYRQFNEYIGQINDLCCIANLLLWDERTQMPKKGGLNRGPQLSTATRMAQERFIDPKMERLIEKAEAELSGEDPDSYRLRNVAAAREAFEIMKKIPLNVMAEQAELVPQAQEKWAEARESSDFSLFQPYLQKMVALKQRLAEAIGYSEHPYDALLHRYEPGMTAARLDQLFGELRRGVLPLLEEIKRREVPRHDFLYRHFDPEQQRAFASRVVKDFGYDFNRGRVDVALHPFEISFTREDVRITTRYNPNYLPMALFGLFHESGHGMYEQGAAPEISRTALATDLLAMYAVAGVSFGMHEAQSRLWENIVGRSGEFWQHYYPLLQQTFPDALADVNAEEFYLSVNRVSPSFIRVEADEVTYNLHIMLRVEAEMGMLDGSIRVEDMPDFWNAKMESYLGITPANDAEGVLQDIHWAAGDYGSFPCYTIGNIIGAQLFSAARKQIPSLPEKIKSADFAPLRGWLQQHIYQHGRAYSPDELLTSVTGKPLSTDEYIDYINQKYKMLFSI